MSDQALAQRVLLEHRFGFSRHQAERLKKRRVYILPTRQGILFALMLLVMLVGAINYDNNLAYLLTFLLASLTLVAIFFTHRNIAGLILNLRSAPAVFAGEVAQFPLVIDNLNQLTRYSLTFQQKKPSTRWYWPWPGLTTLCTIDCLSNSMHQQPLKVPTHQRGELSFGRLITSTVYPLGLFRAWSTADFDARCIVYPHPAGDLPLPEQVVDTPQGEQTSEHGVDDFIGVRAYRDGDSSRQIDWKAYARERGLQRKLFAGNASHRLMFNLSLLFASMDTEAALSQMCQWILLAERQGLAYGLEMESVTIAASIGAHHKHQCLKQLALYGIRDNE